MLCVYFLTTLIVYSQNKIYKAGEIYTDNIYQYGKMEVRMQAATGSGVISNFFTFKEGSELASTFWEEIDIEVFGKDGANSWQTNLITGQGNSNLTRTEEIHQATNLGSEYHTYTIEWKPNSVTWLIDGEKVREIIDGQSSLMTSQTTLRFNIWNPNIPGWVGAFDENILPVHMFVNWIKFYEWNGTSFEATPVLEDNFDSFDSNIWTKANHTFAENMSDFIPENVTTKDGYLVLSITKENETGYTGVPPIDETNNNSEYPVAVISVNQNSGVVPLIVTFDGSNSTDPNNESLNYSWDFADGNTATGSIVSHTFSDMGTYDVNLTVTNASGFSDTETITIEVRNVNSGNNGSCAFDTPISSPLATVHKSYSSIYVLGENGPNLDNVTNFTINWDLNNNGLWQLSMNTNNGLPNWWINLKNSSSHSFSSSEPAIIFNNSGISGFDGTYYVNTIGDDFVMVSDTGDFTIYFSYSGVVPNCDLASKIAETKIVNKEIIYASIYPNPNQSEKFSLNVLNAAKIKLELFDFSGKLIERREIDAYDNIFFGGNLTPGIYFVKLYNENELIKVSRVIKR